MISPFFFYVWYLDRVFARIAVGSVAADSAAIPAANDRGQVVDQVAKANQGFGVVGIVDSHAANGASDIAKFGHNFRAGVVGLVIGIGHVWWPGRRLRLLERRVHASRMAENIGVGDGNTAGFLP